METKCQVKDRKLNTIQNYIHLEMVTISEVKAKIKENRKFLVNSVF